MKQFFRNLFKLKFTCQANSEEDVLIELRDFFKSKYEVDDAVLSPAKPTPNTVLPCTNTEFALPGPNNPLPARSIDVPVQDKYEEELSNRIADQICTKNGIFNIMVNYEDLTTALRRKLSDRLRNYEWYSHTSFDKEITVKGNSILFDMKDNKITENDKLTLFKLFKKHPSNILSLNALHIENVQSYRVIDFFPVSEKIAPIIESKEDYLLSSGHYHFDLLYDVNIIIPTTEMEMKLILNYALKKVLLLKL